MNALIASTGRAMEGSPLKAAVSHAAATAYNQIITNASPGEAIYRMRSWLELKTAFRPDAFHAAVSIVLNSTNNGALLNDSVAKNTQTLCTQITSAVQAHIDRREAWQTYVADHNQR